MVKVYVGIDNGITGNIGIVSPSIDFASQYLPVPVKIGFDYNQKKKKQISRLDWTKFQEFLHGFSGMSTFFILERPFKSPIGFDASISGARCFEAILIGIELFSIPYEVIAPQEWQSKFLPGGLKKTAELKKASAQIGKQLFPMLSEEIDNAGDADGLLLAEYARRCNL